MIKRILFIGDIVGSPGRAIIAEKIQQIREQHSLDFIIANAENAAGGSGLTKSLALELLDAGIDGLTLGNHVWGQHSFAADIDSLEHVCRPANLPLESPGKKFLILNKDGFRLGILTVLGRQFMNIRSECPFKTAYDLTHKLKDLVDACIVEIHAEATAEKIALGWYLDGKVSLVVGTHTHVPTADACILPKGTAYITDVGMTGPYASVLGRTIDPVIKQFVTSMPQKFSVAKEDIRLSGCLFTVNTATGLAESICLFQTVE
jgi:metallophosphoesterase (TIGR00282 family)